MAELREAVKTLLPEEGFSAADLKMTMLAFDTNRNGRIEQEEFINAIEDARNAGLQAGATLNRAYSDEEIPTFERANDSFKGGRPGSSGGLSPEQNLLKILFTDLKEKPAALNDLAEKNLSLMHLYWGKSGEVSDFVDFEARYCLDKGLMSTPEAKAVW